MHLLHLFLLILLLHVFQPFVPFMHNILPSCVGPRFFTVLCQQLRDPPSVPASILPFDLIFLMRAFMIAILCCCFISSSSVDSSCLICRRCNLYSLNKENSRPTILSPFFYSEFLVFAHPPPSQGDASTSKDIFVAFFNIVFVQNFLFRSSSQLLPALDNFTLIQTPPLFHLFSVFLLSDQFFLHLFF